MKKFTITLVFLTVLVTAISAQNDPLRQGQRQIIFYAYGPNWNPWHSTRTFSTAGHAFVGFSSGGVYIEEAWGYYPAGLMNDMDGVRQASVRRAFNVTEAQWTRARNMLEAWRANPDLYILGGQDCINFAYSIARAIGLVHDTFLSNFSLLPTTCVNSIRRP